MAHFSRHSPEVLAVDTNRGWMLMRDFGGQELGPDTPLEVVRTALSDCARLQIATIPHAARLRDLGCPDRSLEVLKIHNETLLARDTFSAPATSPLGGSGLKGVLCASSSPLRNFSIQKPLQP